LIDSIQYCLLNYRLAGSILTTKHFNSPPLIISAVSDAFPGYFVVAIYRACLFHLRRIRLLRSSLDSASLIYSDAT